MEHKITSDVDEKGQLWLPGVPAPYCYRVADVCLRRLCRMFYDKCPLATVVTLPYELDDLSLACVLVAVEWGSYSPEATTVELAGCLDKVAGRFWGDLLPWRLALQFCNNPRGVFGLEELTANLDHHNSNIRLWMFELAWCVRDKINPVEATVRILKNVADTLSHWDSALGLCRALYPTDEAFWAMADGFQPQQDSADQYRNRMDFVRKQGLAVFLQRFERLELRLRRLISQSALGLTQEEITLIEAAS